MFKKYDFEFKLIGVEEYLYGEGGLDYLTEKYVRELKTTRYSRACLGKETVSSIRQWKTSLES